MFKVVRHPVVSLSVCFLITACGGEDPTPTGQGEGGTQVNTGATGQGAAGGSLPVQGGSAGSPGPAGGAPQGPGGTSGQGGSPGGAQGLGGSSNQGGSPGGTGGSSTCTKPCGGSCCNASSICVADPSGNEFCAQDCSDSSECPSASPCCGVLSDGSSACLPNELQAFCRCTTGSQCSSGACAPLTDNNLNPIGPYACVPNDGGPYNGCNGLLTTCEGGFCCFGDKMGNLFCALPCQNASQCGGAKCIPYDNSKTSCDASFGCGLLGASAAPKAPSLALPRCQGQSQSAVRDQGSASKGGVVTSASPCQVPAGRQAPASLR
jgi:hypothetical protein